MYRISYFDKLATIVQLQRQILLLFVYLVKILITSSYISLSGKFISDISNTSKQTKIRVSSEEEVLLYLVNFYGNCNISKMKEIEYIFQI